MRTQIGHTTIYASLLTALFLMTPGAALGPAGGATQATGMDDPAADVYPLGEYSVWVIVPGDEECPGDITEAPSGHNVLTVQDQQVRIDGTYINYDQFVWVWEGEIPECLPAFGALYWILDAEGTGVGITGPDTLVG